MKLTAVIKIAAFGLLLAGCSTHSISAATSPKKNTSWRGVHLFVQSDKSADDLTENLPKLAAQGVNVVIVEVNYSFDFKSHPELRTKNFVTRPHVKQLVTAAKKFNICLIPELDCFGHQGNRNHVLPLLEQHPEFTEPPWTTADKEISHMKGWCPNHPEVNPIVFKLIDEIADAFKAKLFHAGMDEVMNIASDNCPRCQGRDPAELFAKEVNELHGHIVRKRKMEMLIWGDRLLDGKTMKYGKWEGSTVGTWPAIDLIPKDIIICDWHYEKRESYPSVPLLVEKGFRVWPTGWKPLEATKAFSAFTREQRKQNPRVLGYLCTAWGRANSKTITDWPPAVEILKDWKE